MITNMENRLMYAYYVLSEGMEVDAAQSFLADLKMIIGACESLQMIYRPPRELKLSHYILIMDALKSKYLLNSSMYHQLANTLNQCLNLFVTQNFIDHNPFSEWLKDVEFDTLYNLES